MAPAASARLKSSLNQTCWSSRMRYWIRDELEAHDHFFTTGFTSRPVNAFHAKHRWPCQSASHQRRSDLRGGWGSRGNLLIARLVFQSLAPQNILGQDAGPQLSYMHLSKRFKLSPCWRLFISHVCAGPLWNHQLPLTEQRQACQINWSVSMSVNACLS